MNNATTGNKNGQNGVANSSDPLTDTLVIILECMHFICKKIVVLKIVLSSNNPSCPTV